MVDVVAGRGLRHLAAAPIGPGETPTLVFTLTEAAEDVEIRLRGDTGFSALVRGLELESIPIPNDG